MKYLILVHSNLIYGMARQLKAVKAWPDQDLVWVADRQFSVPPDQSKVLDISQLHIEPFRWSQVGQLWQSGRHNRAQLDRLDQLLDRLQDEFTLVLPHLRSFHYYAMVTHPSCRGFYLLEEGKLSYTQGHRWAGGIAFQLKSLCLSTLYRFFLQGRVPAFPPDFDDQHPRYLGAYATSELAFPGLEKVQLIPLPFAIDPELQHYERVLVTGPYSEYGELPLPLQIQALRALFQYLTEQSVTQLHYKFHPAQLAQGTSPPPIRKLMDEFSDVIQFTEIPPQISLENIAASGPAVFYLATSSTAIYAVVMGRKVYSYARYIVKLHPAFQAVLDDLPPVIREQMNWLELGQ